MLEILSNPFAVALMSFGLSCVLTYFVREFARKNGFVAKPKLDRWHKKPTAMMGGTAVFLTTIIIYLLFVPHTPKSLIILAGSSVLFIVGLIDDFLHIKPYQKLIGQFIGAGLVIGFGLVLPWTDSPILNIAITGFWLIGITNAINLLDNMDGLAAGISAIAALALAVGLAISGQQLELVLLTAFIGALIGFLVFNFNPASIFMGDCGSMFIGFLLASSVMLNQVGGRSRSVFSVLAVPVLILFVPIFDTTFVTVLRKLWGRRASQGGRDHTSHRLVALGLSERSAVILLYALALVAGAISILITELQPIQSLALIGVFIIVLAIIGVYLAKVQVYGEDAVVFGGQNQAVSGFLLNLSHKRRVFEVILDAFLISLAYYAAYIMSFGEFEDSGNWTLFINTLPLLIVLKLGAFLVVGVYRGIWRYTSIQDFLTFLKGVVLGSILSVMAILFLYRFQNFSRQVFIVDGIILFLALAGSRTAFKLFRSVLPTPMSREGRKVLIYGAGDGGEMVLREIKNNPELNYKAVGFIDDDTLKRDKLIHGLRVFGGNGSLLEICRANDVEEILISFRQASPEKINEIRLICQESNISLKRAMLKIESVDYE